MFTSMIRMGIKCEVSDFNRGMIVGARWAGLSIPLTADLLGFSIVYSEWCKKQKKHLVSGGSSADGNQTGWS